MRNDDQTYDQRRAATQKLLAKRTSDPGVVKAHMELAELHSNRARDASREMRGKVLSLFY